MDAVTLPLIAMRAVLFPRMAVWLHLCAPHELKLAECCLQGDRRLGVALSCMEGKKKKAMPPCRIGTSARILEVSRHQDGRLDLMVLGQDRFQLRECVQTDPYLIGRVEWVPEGSAAMAIDAAAVTALLTRYLEQLLPTGYGPNDPEIPADPAALSYTVAALLPVDLWEKQALLEMKETGARLRREKLLLVHEIALQQQRETDTKRVLRPLRREDFSWLDVRKN